MRIKLPIKTNSKKYPIIIGSNLLQNIQSIFKSCNLEFNKCLIVVDKKIPKKKLFFLKKKIKCKEIIIFLFNSSEKNKNQSTVNNIIKKLLRYNFKRNDVVISFGGGITGDVSGYAASIFKRGIKFVNIPTTLLAQVDSSIGGKTGINNNYGKNLIGSFYQPRLVISDIALLKSLPKREIVCGYAEILKHALIKKSNFFNWLKINSNKLLKNGNPRLLQTAIFKSCKIKLHFVNKDLKEKNTRMILNFGHTFGHAFEATKNFSKKINHGESVLLGMMCAIEFGYLKKILKKNDLNTIKKHYLKLSLPGEIKRYFKKKDVKKIITFMATDKKNLDENIKLILINRIGNTLKPKNYSKSVLKKFLSLKLT